VLVAERKRGLSVVQGRQQVVDLGAVVSLRLQRRNCCGVLSHERW
jgi:hypothetical protein